MTMATSMMTGMTTDITTMMTDMTMPTITNTTSNSTCINAMSTVIAPEDCDFLSTAALVFVILSLILILWGVFNNIILLLIIFSNGREMRTLPNVFIANMAFLSILFLGVVGGGNLFVFGQVAFQVQFVGEAAGSVTFFIQIFVSLASFGILVALGFDRYLSIVHPLRTRPYRTKKSVIFLNLVVWFVAALCMIPVFVGGGTRDVFENYKIPTYRWSMVTFVTFAYVLPTCAIVIMYTAILKVICCNSPAELLHGDEQARRWHQRIQVFKSISFVIVAFVTFYGFFFGVFIWISVGGHESVSMRVSNVLLYAALLGVNVNKAINPLIYALHQKSFRPYVYKLLCPKSCDLRTPIKGALNTTLGNIEAVVHSAIPMTSRTVLTGQTDCVPSSDNGTAEHDGQTDNNMEEVSHQGHLNEGYHDKEDNKDGEDVTRKPSVVASENIADAQLDDIEASV